MTKVTTLDTFWVRVSQSEHSLSEHTHTDLLHSRIIDRTRLVDSTMPSDHEDDDGPPGTQDDLTEDGHTLPNNALESHLDVASSQLLESPQAQLHINDQTTRTTDLTQIEGDNTNGECGSNAMRESLPNKSTMKRPEAFKALDRIIDDSSDDNSLIAFDPHSPSVLYNPTTDQPGEQVAGEPGVQVAGDEAASSTLQTFRESGTS